MARAIPISVIRDAASMTNTRNISNSPTMIENEPNIPNIVVKKLPTMSAISRRLTFTSLIRNISSSASMNVVASAMSEWPASSSARMTVPATNGSVIDERNSLLAEVPASSSATSSARSSLTASRMSSSLAEM